MHIPGGLQIPSFLELFSLYANDKASLCLITGVDKSFLEKFKVKHISDGETTHFNFFEKDN